MSDRGQTIFAQGRFSIVFAKHPPTGFRLLKPGREVAAGCLSYSTTEGWHPARPGMNSKIFVIAERAQ